MRALSPRLPAPTTVCHGTTHSSFWTNTTKWNRWPSINKLNNHKWWIEWQHSHRGNNIVMSQMRSKVTIFYCSNSHGYYYPAAIHVCCHMLSAAIHVCCHMLSAAIPVCCHMLSAAIHVCCHMLSAAIHVCCHMLSAAIHVCCHMLSAAIHVCCHMLSAAIHVCCHMLSAAIHVCCHMFVISNRFSFVASSDKGRFNRLNHYDYSS